MTQPVLLKSWFYKVSHERFCRTSLYLATLFLLLTSSFPTLVWAQYTYAGKIGEGSEPLLVDPSDVKPGNDGKIYITDSQADRIAIINNGVTSYFRLYDQPAALDNVRTLAINPMADTLFVVSNSGQLQAITTAGVIAWKVTTSNYYQQLKISPLNGHIYMLESNSCKIFTRKGQLLKTFTVGVYAQHMDFDQSGNVYIAGDQSTFVYVFDPNGNALRTMQLTYQVKSLAIDKTNKLYTGIWHYLGGVHVYENNGTYNSVVPNTSAIKNVQFLSFDKNDNMTVLDINRFEISVISKTGVILSKIAAAPAGTIFTPEGISFDQLGNTYITNYIRYTSYMGVHVFDKTFSYVKKIGSYVTTFDRAKDIEVIDNQQIYVLDDAKFKVAKFTLPGNYVTSFLYQPYNSVAGDMTVGRDGYLYFSFWNIISKHDKNGNYIATTTLPYGTGPGQMYGASGVAVDESGNFYISSTYVGGIRVFSPAGAFIRQIGTQGTATGQVSKLAGIWLDATGKLFVSDEGRNMVLVFDKDGTFLQEIGGAGHTDGKFFQPGKLAVNPNTGELFVTDRGNLRVHRYAPPKTTMNVLRNGTVLASGSATNLGTVGFGATQTYTFSVSNTGSQPLYLTDAPKIAFAGDNAANFTADFSQVPSPLAAGASATFTISYTPLAAGTKATTATLLFNGTTPAYTFTLNSTVIKGNQTITFGPLASAAFGGPKVILAATTSSGLPVSYTSSNPAVATISGNELTIVGAGSTIITAKQAGNENYNAAIDVTHTFTVSKINQTLTFNALPAKTYGDAAFTLSVPASSGLAASFVSSNLSVATISGNMITVVGAGTTTITAKQAGNANYNAATDISQTLTVNKASLTIRPDNKTRIYGGSTPAYTFTYTGFVNGDDATVLDVLPVAGTGAGATSNVGTYAITTSGAGDNNYFISYGSGVLTITKAPLTITANNQSKTYGAVNPALDVTYSGFRNNETQSVIDSKPVISTSAAANSVPGTYSITLSGGSDNNYELTLVNGTLTINKTALTVTAVNVSREYGLNNPSLGISYAGFVLNENASVLDQLPVAATVATQTSDAGNYTINVGSGADNTYSFTYAPGTLTVTKAPLQIKAENKTREFGQANPELTLTYAGFRNSNTAAVLDVLPQVSTSAAQNSQVGTYAISLSGGSDNNYAFTLVNAQLTITQASQNITFSELIAKNMNDPAFDVSATASSGLEVNLEVVSGPATVSGKTVTLSGLPGTVVIKATQAGSLNYQAAMPVERSFEVNTKQIQIINFPPIADREYSADLISLTAEGGASGNPVTFTVVSGLAEIVENNQLRILGAGIITIQASQAGNQQYNQAASIIRSFSVAKAGQDIDFPVVGDKMITAAPFALQATASSGLSVTFEVVSGNVQIVNGLLTATGEGKVTIKALQTGNNAYLPAEATQTFCITPAKPVITTEGTVTTAAFTLHSSSNSGNQWLKDGVEISGATAKSYDVTEKGVYTVRVTINECSATSEPLTLTSSEEVLGSLVKVYPTITPDVLHIELPQQAKQAKVAIYSLTGVKMADISVKGHAHVLNVAHLPQGLYLLEITFHSTVVKARFIKQ